MKNLLYSILYNTGLAIAVVVGFILILIYCLVFLVIGYVIIAYGKIKELVQVKM